MQTPKSHHPRFSHRATWDRQKLAFRRRKRYAVWILARYKLMNQAVAVSTVLAATTAHPDV